MQMNTYAPNPCIQAPFPIPTIFFSYWGNVWGLIALFCKCGNSCCASSHEASYIYGIYIYQYTHGYCAGGSCGKKLPTIRAGLFELVSTDLIGREMEPEWRIRTVCAHLFWSWMRNNISQLDALTQGLDSSESRPSIGSHALDRKQSCQILPSIAPLILLWGFRATRFCPRVSKR